MSATHTPGPWILRGDTIFGGEDSCFWIAGCHAHYPENAEQQAANAAHIVQCVNAHDVAERVALDIAKWFINGDRPDEWKLKEWAESLDRDAISKAYDAAIAYTTGST